MRFIIGGRGDDTRIGGTSVDTLFGGDGDCGGFVPLDNPDLTGPARIEGFVLRNDALALRVELPGILADGPGGLGMLDGRDVAVLAQPGLTAAAFDAAVVPVTEVRLTPSPPAP